MYLYMPCGFALHVVERQVLIADANWHFTFWMCCLFESKVSEKCCRVLMACSHSDGESAPTLRYLITNQAALLQEPLPPPPQPRLQRTKSCTVSHSGTAAAFSSDVQLCPPHLRRCPPGISKPMVQNRTGHSPCSTPPSSCAPYFSKCHHHLPRCTRQKPGGSL